MTFSAKRFHDFSYGHRVHGHEGKCAHLHGHNGRVHFHCRVLPFSAKSSLDAVGRVIDFSAIKSLLCEWLEQNWDHKMLMWDMDPLSRYVKDIDNTVVIVPFNPTAENMAAHLVKVVGPQLLDDLEIQLYKVEFEETCKCSATFELE